MFKKIVFLFLALSFFLLNPVVSRADETQDLQNKIAEYTQKLSELGSAKNTLSNQIKILTSQYDLTLLKITQTENSIKSLDKEINNLTIKIDDLDKKLNSLASLYVLQIIQNYKLQKNAPPFAFLFSTDLNNYLEQYKYVSNVQTASQNSMINIQTVKSDYDTQKTQKAEKQQEMEALQKTLAAQKTSLDNQKIAKDKLLETTKNDEKKYQQLLNDAIAQLNAFQSFISSSGGATLLSNQTHCDDWGCYYNQRDSEWGNIVFGYNDNRDGTKTYYDMKGYGCLLTSTTMILSHFGKSVKPSDLANNSSLFFGHSGNMLQGSLSTNGINFSRTTIGYNLSSADSELSAGRPVIAGVNGINYPSHYIVIKYKKDGQYIIYDPYPENGYKDSKTGGEKTLSSTNYKVSRIDSIKIR